MNCITCGKEIFPDKDLRGNIKTGEFYCVECAVKQIPEKTACPECEKLKAKLKEYEEQDSDDRNYWKNQLGLEKLETDYKKLQDRYDELRKSKKGT